MNRPVLVTGACGMLGTEVVKRLAAAGDSVVAVDLENPTTTKVAARFSELGDVRTAYADLTVADAIGEVVKEANPRAVIHLAAVIPPVAYMRPQVAERVNIGGTANLVAAIEACTDPARLILASSVAVYGSRNGAKDIGVVTADTPLNPRDVYGYHKVKAEAAVRASSLKWAVLRIGGIMGPELVQRVDKHSILMDGLIPRDNRIHTVHTLEVAEAFANAADADCIGKTLLIAGDESHMLRQEEFNIHMMAVAGLHGGQLGVRGRAGSPDDDSAWFVTDWMDVAPARAVLGFTPISISESVTLCKAELSPLRNLLGPFGRVAQATLSLTSPYRRAPGKYADPWSIVAAKYGAGALAPT